MAFDLEAWVKDLGLSEEERKVVAPVFQSRLEKLEQGQLRQSEFSRRMNEMSQQREQMLADLRQRAEAVTSDYQRLGEWEGQVKQLRAQDRQELEQKSQRIAALEQRMRSLGAEHGIPESDLGLEGVPLVTTSSAPASSAVDDRYLTREDWQKAERDIRLLPEVDAEMDDIVDDVRELTGGRVRRRELLRELRESNEKLPMTAPRISLRQFAEDKFKLVERRNELERKKQEEHDNRIRTEAETRVRSEFGVSTPRPSESRRSPVLERAAAANKTATQQPEYRQPTAVSRAVQAYNEGKYQSQ